MDREIQSQARSVRQWSSVFRNSRRTQILLLLSAAIELNVGELARSLDMSKSAASNYVLELTEAGLLIGYRSGRRRLVRLTPLGLESTHALRIVALLGKKSPGVRK